MRTRKQKRITKELRKKHTAKYSRIWNNGKYNIICDERPGTNFKLGRI